MLSHVSCLWSVGTPQQQWPSAVHSLTAVHSRPNKSPQLAQLCFICTSLLCLSEEPPHNRTRREWHSRDEDSGWLATHSVLVRRDKETANWVRQSSHHQLKAVILGLCSSKACSIFIPLLQAAVPIGCRIFWGHFSGSPWIWVWARSALYLVPPAHFLPTFPCT